MIEALVHASVVHRRAVLWITLVAAVLAAVVAARLRFDALPDVTTNQVLVLTRATGLTPEEVERKIRGMYTDPTRLRATDPGHVEGNPVFQYHDAFNDDTAEVDDLKERYTQGKVGDVEVKRKLTAALERFLAPIRERRAHFESKPGLVEEVIAEGSRRARREAEETIRLVRDAMGINYFAAERPDMAGAAH